MLSAILYILFFAAFNACINSSLSGIFAIPSHIKKIVYIFGAVFFVLHFVLLSTGYLYPPALFFTMCMMSLMLVIFTFMARFMAKRMSAFVASNPRLDGSAAAGALEEVRNLMVTRLLPIMIFCMQLAIISFPKMRYDMMHNPKNKEIVMKNAS